MGISLIVGGSCGKPVRLAGRDGGGFMAGGAFFLGRAGGTGGAAPASPRLPERAGNGGGRAYNAVMRSLAARFPARLRSGWTVCVLMAITVLAFWAPDMNLPLGDGDEGRILARFGLQARNFWEMGPAESEFGARIDPYIRSEFAVEPGGEPPAAAVTYAHHPPLQIFGSIAAVGLLGDRPAALRTFGFGMGMVALLGMAALLRNLGLGWGAALLAVGAMAVTGFFFVYGRMGAGFSLIAASAAAVAYLRERDDPPRWMTAGTGVLAALTAMQSWIAMAAMGLLVLWLFARRRWSPATWWAAAGAAAGVAVTAGWILAATPVSELGEVVAGRTDTARFALGEFLARQWDFAGRLTPVWFRAAAPFALLAGVADRRTRIPVLITLGVAAGWTFGLQQGAWVHLLWNFPWVAPITIGLGAGLDRLRRWVPGRVSGAAALLAGAALAVALYGTFAGPARSQFLTEPAAAGEVLLGVSPTPPPGKVWAAPGVSTARWASYYLDAPVWPLSEEWLPLAEPGDLVIVRADRAPGFIPDRALQSARASAGRYRLLEGRELAG